MNSCRASSPPTEIATSTPPPAVTPTTTDTATTSGATDSCFPQPDSARTASRGETILGLDQGQVLWSTDSVGAEGCFTRTSGQWSRLYDVSPSGMRLLMGFSLRELFRVHLTDSSVERLTPEAVGAIWLNEDTFLAWSGDGKLWSAQVDNVTPCGVDSGVTSAAYCSHLGQLAIERQPHPTARHVPGIYLLDVTQESQEATLLTSEIATKWGIAGSHVLWSSECRHILFPVDPTEPEEVVSDYLAIIDVETREVHRLRLPLPSGPLYLSASGQRLFYHSESLDRPTDTWVVDLDWDTGEVTTMHVLNHTLVLEGPGYRSNVLVSTAEGLKVLNLDDLTLHPVRVCP